MCCCNRSCYRYYYRNDRDENREWCERRFREAYRNGYRDCRANRRRVVVSDDDFNNNLNDNFSDNFRDNLNDNFNDNFNDNLSDNFSNNLSDNFSNNIIIVVVDSFNNNTV